MRRLLLLVLLCAATPVVNCQQSTKSGTTPRPDNGTFVQNTYRNDFFGFSYALPRGFGIYGRLNNFLNQKYEESLGFPASHLNFLAGVRFSFPAE